MTKVLNNLENERVALQAELDRQKTQAERNRLGQFATPTGLAEDVLRFAASLLPPGEMVHFLDPAIGTGAFYSALCKTFPRQRISEAVGYEIDRHYGEPAARLWRNAGLSVRLADFTRAKPEPRFNLIICNPPYVRHHHLENGEKGQLQLRTLRASGVKLSGLAGLYCYFIGLSHAWMREGGIAGWLVPSEFMDVNYGHAIKRYLLDRVTLLRVHRFDPADVQFADALVSSAVVWFRNTPPPEHHSVTFTFGGTLIEPKLSREIPATALRQEPKWTRFPREKIRLHESVPTLSDFFQIKRGLATGDNSFFILTEEEIAARHLPMEVFTPILPSPRYLTGDEITADGQGNPRIEPRLFLLDTKLPEEEIKRRFPPLHAYLQEGRARGLHERYLCQHRALWYGQENRPPAPIVCTYLGRSDTKRQNPFRFILNGSRATAANVYLAMYPTAVLARAMERDPSLIRRVWEVLNHLTPDQVLEEGRVYGGGLHKLEPKELANVAVPEIENLLGEHQRPVRQAELFARHVS
ncbi:MAG: Eco57I restriction-modification methylase domain-containing protein [Chloroflexota bacterium]|nr:Eco57I restriction-modification methylase domain-containing protein [Chloroflexota bacterium]